MAPDVKSARKKRGSESPLVARKPTGELTLVGGVGVAGVAGSTSGGSTTRLRALQTESSALSTSGYSDGHSDSEPVSFLSLTNI